MSAEYLATCVITDPENHVLLLHRTDHNQWQLPGGRPAQSELTNFPEDPLEAVVRKTKDELGIDIAPARARLIGQTVFRQGVVEYSCDWFQARDYSGVPILGRPDTYDAWGYFNLYKRGIGRIGLSPNVEKLTWALQNDELRL
jgi:ADP-ribose pyrophosphatase YjhB (NUDIX family)